MNSNINEHQTRAYDKLSKLKSGALFMKMGAGKTKVAVDLLISRQHDYSAIAWIAPASLINEQSYKAEIYKWAAALYRPIRFFSVEGLSASSKRFLELYQYAGAEELFCVVDESITIKNTEAGRTGRLLKIGHLFKFRLILNGTPVTKGLIDLYSQMTFISPHILNMTETQFANKFLTYRLDGHKPWTRWSRPENEAALVEILRPYIYDCDLEIDIDLDEHNVDFALNADEKTDYQNFKEQYLATSGRVLDFLAIAQKFQSFYTTAASKLEALEKDLAANLAAAEKTIIYVKFLHEIETLKKSYPNAIIYNGEVKEDLGEFKKKQPFLIMTYGVGSRGLNLQHANNIIFFSPTFDYMQVAHAKCRILRPGQNRAVKIKHYFLNTGLDRLISKSLNKKENVSTHLQALILKNGADEL